MWLCKKCKEELEDSFDACWSCGYEKGNKIELEEENTIELDGIKKTTDEIRKENQKLMSLRYKYNFLNLFKTLIIISILLYTGVFIYGFKDTIEIAEKFDQPSLILLPIASYLLFLFNSICIIAIVNFLFALDKTKSDRN